MDASGDLFGTTYDGGYLLSTYDGGADGDGTVFELVNNGSGSYTFTTLTNFNGTDGYGPQGLIIDAAGDLFGMTQQGGLYGQGGTVYEAGYGTVFEVPHSGGSYASTPTTLVNFNLGAGEYPVGGLIANAAGDLFGTSNRRPTRNRLWRSAVGLPSN